MDEFIERIIAHTTHDPVVSAFLTAVSTCGILLLKFLYWWFLGKTAEKAVKIMRGLSAAKADEISTSQGSIQTRIQGCSLTVRALYRWDRAIYCRNTDVSGAIGLRDSRRIYRLCRKIIRRHDKAMKVKAIQTAYDVVGSL